MTWLSKYLAFKYRAKCWTAVSSFLEWMSWGVWLRCQMRGSEVQKGYCEGKRLPLSPVYCIIAAVNLRTRHFLKTLSRYLGRKIILLHFYGFLWRCLFLLWAQAWSCRLNALSSDATPGHREPCAETNARVGIKFAAQNVLDVSTVVALSYVLWV